MVPSPTGPPAKCVASVVDAEHFQGAFGDFLVDHAFSADFRDVAGAAQDAVRNSGRASAFGTQDLRRFFGNADVQNFGTADKNLLQILCRVKVQAVVQTETVTEWTGEKSGTGRGADERKMLERKVHRSCRGTGIEHNVQPEIFHCGVEIFFDYTAQAVNFVDKKNIVFTKACEKSGEIARFFKDGAACNVNPDSHFFGDDSGESRFT